MDILKTSSIKCLDQNIIGHFCVTLKITYCNICPFGLVDTSMIMQIMF